MPRKLYDEEGNEFEVPTEEELASLNEAQTKVGDLEKAKEDWEKEKRDLEEAANPNWKEAREKIRKLEALSKQGKTIDDDGNVVDANKPVEPAEIEKTAEAVALKTLRTTEVKKLLNKYPSDQRENVEQIYNRLADENISIDQIPTVIGQAARAAGLETNRNPLSSAINSDGEPPRIVKTNSDDVKAVAEKHPEVTKALGITDKDIKKLDK